MDACDLSGICQPDAPTLENAGNGQESTPFDAVAEIMGHFIDTYRSLKLSQIN